MYFADVIGHKTVKNNLINLVKTDKAGHAYIFTGPKGIGKYKTALSFASALLCDEFENDSCGKCKNCNLSFGGAHPDLKAEDYSKDADGKEKASISVEAIRGFKTDVYLKPFYSKRKIYILDNADKLTVEAQNALLKIFEEPPSYTTVILICHNISKILPTIISRAVLIKFSALTPGELEIYLNKYYNETANKDIHARIANGSIASMIKNIEDETAIDFRNSVLQGASELFISTQPTAFNTLFSVFMKNKDRRYEINEYLSVFVLDCLFYKAGLNNRIVNTDKLSEIGKIVRELKLDEIRNIESILISLTKRFAENANYKLAVLDALIRIREEIHG